MLGAFHGSPYKINIGGRLKLEVFLVRYFDIGE